MSSFSSSTHTAITSSTNQKQTTSLLNHHENTVQESKLVPPNATSPMKAKNPSTINPSINRSDCKSVAARLSSSLEHTPRIKLVGQNGIALVQRLSNSKRIGWCAVLGLSVLQTLIPLKRFFFFSNFPAHLTLSSVCKRGIF